jgi:hypothetical protein
MSEDMRGGRGEGAAPYYKWVREEAAKIGSDACTASKDWQVHCCYEHDLACYYKRDPKVAYSLGWAEAPLMTRREADKMFTKCNLASSRGFLGTARSLLRYVGVRMGALWPF